MYDIWGSSDGWCRASEGQRLSSSENVREKFAPTSLRSGLRGCVWCMSAMGWRVGIVVNPGRGAESRLAFIFRAQL